MYSYKILKTSDISLFRDLMQLFGKVFEEPDTYTNNNPSDEYVKRFLSNENNFILVALNEKEVIGGFAGYILDKFEQERKELFIYDLAVKKEYQGKGVGTGLLIESKHAAKSQGIHAIFVEADGDDDKAKQFYRKVADEEITAAHFTLFPNKNNI